jgi:hypothetical protein
MWLQRRKENIITWPFGKDLGGVRSRRRSGWGLQPRPEWVKCCHFPNKRINQDEKTLGVLIIRCLANRGVWAVKGFLRSHPGSRPVYGCPSSTGLEPEGASAPPFPAQLFTFTQQRACFP